MLESLDNWFKREILAHEASLNRYLQRFWPRRSEIPDLRQEIFTRVYQAAKKSRPQSSAKSFLFSTARHLMADRIRRKKIVAIDSVADLDALNVPVPGQMVDELSPEHHLLAHQELRRLAQAIDGLPPKCRKVIWMRRVDDLSQREVAARLGISEKSVEKHVIKGMRILERTFYGTPDEVKADPGDLTQDEQEHG